MTEESSPKETEISTTLNNSAEASAASAGDTEPEAEIQITNEVQDGGSVEPTEGTTVDAPSVEISVDDVSHLISMPCSSYKPDP